MVIWTKSVKSATSPGASWQPANIGSVSLNLAMTRFPLALHCRLRGHRVYLAGIGLPCELQLTGFLAVTSTGWSQETNDDESATVAEPCRLGGPLW
jgi:hypothetical protein